MFPHSPAFSRLGTPFYFTLSSTSFPPAYSRSIFPPKWRQRDNTGPWLHPQILRLIPCWCRYQLLLKHCVNNSGAFCIFYSSELQLKGVLRWCCLCNKVWMWLKAKNLNLAWLKRDVDGEGDSSGCWGSLWMLRALRSGLTHYFHVLTWVKGHSLAGWKAQLGPSVSLTGTVKGSGKV